MAITSGLQHLHETFPEIWEWIPLVILNRYKELEIFLRAPRDLRKLNEKTDATTPVIPFVGTCCFHFLFVLEFQSTDIRFLMCRYIH